MPDPREDESMGLEQLPEAELDTPAGSGKVETPVDAAIHPANPAATVKEPPAEAKQVDAEELRSSKQPRIEEGDRRLETR